MGDGRNLVVELRQFETDADWLEAYLVERGGLARLQALRFARLEELMHGRIAVPVLTIAANARALSDATVLALFAGLAPAGGPLVRIRRGPAFGVYDRVVRLHEVRLPLLLFNLVRLGVFRGRPAEARARELYRRGEEALTFLALQEPWQLFHLGPSWPRERWRRDLLESPADVLLHSSVDVSGPRASRHMTLRRELNRALRRCGVSPTRPSKAHRAVRALLDGAGGAYVL